MSQQQFQQQQQQMQQRLLQQQQQNQAQGMAMQPQAPMQMGNPQARMQGMLLLSGSSDDEDLARAHRIGAKGYVANPLDGYMLLRAIRRLRPRAGEGSGAQGSGAQGAM